MADVVLVRWPDESERPETLRAAGPPRLLLVPAGAAPPVTVDPLEDWVRLPADQAEIRTRLATLSSRATTDRPTPAVDTDGLLHYRDRWVALSPVEQALAAV